MPFVERPAEPAKPASPIPPLHDALLGQFLAQPPASAIVPAPAARSTARRGSWYDDVMTWIALGAALLLCLGLWYAGASFTVAVLQRIGGLSALGGLIWVVPVGLTALEVRLGPWRHRGMVSRAIWAVVLSADVGTTVLGVAPWVAIQTINGWVPDTASVWGIAIVVGLLCAIVPEPAARALLRENR